MNLDLKEIANDPGIRSMLAKAAYMEFIRETGSHYSCVDGSDRALFNTLPEKEQKAWEKVVKKITDQLFGSEA